MGVKETVSDPDKRCGRAVGPRPQAADRAFRRGQPLPGVLVDLQRQLDLVKFEIAAPQLGPAVAVPRDDRGDDDLHGGEPSAFLLGDNSLD